jgi:hypothetical protein
MPSQAFRGYQHATGSARELDMIDELDETNPSGVALHHGGPYEAIQKVTPSRAQVQRTAHAVSSLGYGRIISKDQRSDNQILDKSAIFGDLPARVPF